MSNPELVQAVLNVDEESLAAIMSGHRFAYIQVRGTFSAVLQIEGTVDGNTWFAVEGRKPILVSDTPVFVTTLTNAGDNLQVDAAGLTFLRVRVSAYTSGEATVSINTD